MQIFSFSPFGYEGAIVAVEVDLRRGIPSVDIVGLADGAVKESRERMKAAIQNSGFTFPLERVLISLSPADLKKEGAGFDLALALATLNASSDSKDKDEKENQEFTYESGDEPVLVMGELELSGTIRPVKAVHAAASTAAAAGIYKCIVAAANASEAREVEGMKVFGAGTLSQAVEAMRSPELFTSGEEKDLLPEGCVKINGVAFPPEDKALEFSDIKGQHNLVRGLQIAAAGGHNLLAFGPPGCGKTLSLQKFPALLPLLTPEEAQTVTRIYSLAGLLSQNQSLIRQPPFRIPHQTASIEGICGGGTNCRPGEISLAHNGVLFLDEAAEFKSSVLQMLRVPIECGSITLSRAGRSTTYPANFQLLMATNPCPCGNFGVPGKICLCSARSVEQYWRKFSGPLLDRVEIRAAVNSKDSDEEKNPSTAELRKKIATAVRIQRKRQGKRNAYLSPQEILEYCALGKEEQDFLNKSIRNFDFSQRAVSGILKLSRTIADMEDSQKIKCDFIKEAISYRKNVGPLDLFNGE